jgi:D-sedoheptulose 7-phosphate isomerase
MRHARMAAMTDDTILATLRDSRSALEALIANADAIASIRRAGDLLVETFERRGRVYSCGNGGSMCDAMHFAEELTGRYRLDRRALPAVAISDASHLTCVGNDYGYDQVFSRYVEAHGREGDCLVAITTSGGSRNVVRAAEAARAQGVRVIALTGRQDAAIASLADVHVCTPGGQYADRVQELHIKVLHILIESVERKFFPENYATAG